MLDLLILGLHRNSMVYADNLQILKHLEANIRQTIAIIKQLTLKKAIDDWTHRVRHFKTLLIKDSLYTTITLR